MTPAQIVEQLRLILEPQCITLLDGTRVIEWADVEAALQQIRENGHV